MSSEDFLSILLFRDHKDAQHWEEREESLSLTFSVMAGLCLGELEERSTRPQSWGRKSSGERDSGEGCGRRQNSRIKS